MENRRGRKVDLRKQLMQGTMNIAFDPMTILLVFWVCASMALCLALLSVAARQVPRMDEETAAGCEPALRRETAVALGQAKTAYPPSWSKLPSAPLHAQTEKSIHVESDDPLMSLRSIPVFHAGMAGSRLWPRWYDGNPENCRVEIRAPAVGTGARAESQHVPPRQPVSSEERVETFGAIYDQV